MPKCPYCEGDISFDNIVREKPRKVIAVRAEIMYSCPHCGKILSIATSAV